MNLDFQTLVILLLVSFILGMVAGISLGRPGIVR